MKQLSKHLQESLRIKIDDEPEYDIESTDTLYRVDITKDCIYVDIHNVKGLLIHKTSVTVKGAISIACSAKIDGDFEYVPEDNYMFSYIRNNEQLRLIFLPEAKDKFYNLFDPIYSFGHGLKIVIDDVCELLGIDSITKMLQDWTNYALTINSIDDVLDTIHKYENNDK